MPRNGTWANRGADHRSAQSRAYAAARDDRERLAAAFAWFRSSASLLSRRRPPQGAPQGAHAEAADRLTREMTAYLKERAEAIDRGDYDRKE